MEKQGFLVPAVLQYHTCEYVSPEELDLADVVLLESGSRLANLFVVLQGVTFKLSVPLRPMEPTAELECLFLVFRPIFADDRNFCFFHEYASGGSAGGVVRPRALLLRALEAGALLGTAV